MLLPAVLFLAGLQALVANPVVGNVDDTKGNLFHVRRSMTADFDDHVQDFVYRKAREVNRHVSWFDAYGQHPHLQERPQYSRYKISASARNMKYGEVSHKIDLPNIAYNKWFHNGQSDQPILAKISRETRTESSFTWSVMKGLKIKTEIKAEFSIPEILDMTAGFSTELDLSKTTTKTVKDSDTFSITYDLTISPNKSVNAKWTIIEREVEVPWETDVYVSGWVAVWYSEKYDGHWLWFYPVWMTADGDFVENGNGILYRTSGVFRGVRGIDSDFRIAEYPLVPHNPITDMPSETPEDPIRVYSVSKEVPGCGED